MLLKEVVVSYYSYKEGGGQHVQNNKRVMVEGGQRLRLKKGMTARRKRVVETQEYLVIDRGDNSLLNVLNVTILSTAYKKNRRVM